MRFTSLLLANLAALGSLLPGVLAQNYTGYLFTYFTGNTIEGEKVYLAISRGNNALDWVELNKGNPVLTSTLGTKGVRDPFIIRAQNGMFYILATDLSVGSGTTWGDAVRRGSRAIEIWESTDLINWGQQRHAVVAPPTAGNVWAPEAFWDAKIGKYIVFWASSLYSENDPNRNGNSYHRMMYSTTSDFINFSEAQIWQDTGVSRIDSTIYQEGDVYYRFTKDEGDTKGCGRDVFEERSTDLLSPPADWQMVVDCIGRKAGTKAVEGPTVFRANHGDVNGQPYFLFADEYSGRGYIPLQSDSISTPNWRISPSYKLPKNPRHGTVMPLTSEEMCRLYAYWRPI